MVSVRYVCNHSAREIFPAASVLYYQHARQRFRFLAKKPELQSHRVYSPNCEAARDVVGVTSKGRVVCYLAGYVCTKSGQRR